MRTYKHLTMTDRLRIEKWLKMGMKPREVADKLRVHVSTVYRELKRGAYDRLDGGTWEVKTAYSPDIAEEKYQAHLREKGPDLKIGNDHELANYIETTILDKDCSPAAVLGFAMIEGKKFKTSLSVPTIYKYIAKGLFLNLTQEELPRHGKKKHKYFCHPYSSWERGTNENTNGMIRRRFPKGTNFAAVTNAQIVQAENWINNYPRKILGYKSSEIVFRECLRELGIAA